MPRCAGRGTSSAAATRRHTIGSRVQPSAAVPRPRGLAPELSAAASNGMIEFLPLGRPPESNQPSPDKLLKTHDRRDDPAQAAASGGMNKSPPPGRPPESDQPPPDALKTHPTHTPATLREISLEEAPALIADPPLSIDYTAIPLNALDLFDLSLTAVPTANFDCSFWPPLPDPDDDIGLDFHLGSPSRALFALAPHAPRLDLHHHA